MSNVRKYFILVMKVEKQCGNDESYITELINVIRANNNIPIVISNSFSPHYRYYEWNRICYFEVGTWLPRSIGGRFKDTCYVIRSAYTALWTVFNTNYLSPLATFSSANSVAVPLLRWFGKAKVVAMEYWQELLTRDRPASYYHMLRVNTRLCSWFMSQANDIIVPCERAQRAFLLAHEKCCNIIPIVVYPPVEGEIFTQQLEGNRMPSPIYYQKIKSTNNETFFLTIGPLEKRSNFEIVLEAFGLLLSRLKSPFKEQVLLYVVGDIDYSIKEQVTYMKFLRSLIKYLSYNKQIIFKTNLDTVKRCLLFASCESIVLASEYDDFDWNILDSQFFGRPIICNKTGFAKEIIVNRTNGYLSYLNAETFANFMFDQLRRPGIYNLAGESAIQKYVKRYSSAAFAEIIANILDRYALKLDLFVSASESSFNYMRDNVLNRRLRYQVQNPHRMTPVNNLRRQNSTINYKTNVITDAIYSSVKEEFQNSNSDALHRAQLNSNLKSKDKVWYEVIHNPKLTRKEFKTTEQCKFDLFNEKIKKRYKNMYQTSESSFFIKNSEYRNLNTYSDENIALPDDDSQLDPPEQPTNSKNMLETPDQSNTYEFTCIYSDENLVEKESSPNIYFQNEINEAASSNENDCSLDSLSVESETEIISHPIKRTFKDVLYDFGRRLLRNCPIIRSFIRQEH